MAGYQAPWDMIWDIGVVGGGLAGLAAAWELAATGQRVLLITPDGDLAWECGRSYSLTAGEDGGSWFSAWRSRMAERGVSSSVAIDGPQGELAAHALLEQQPGVRWLGYASPVALEITNDQLASVIVATKGGLRRMVAGRWLDATDEGLLGALHGDETTAVPAAWNQHWLLLQDNWSQEPSLPVGLPEGITAAWAPAAWPSERRLVLTAASEAILRDHLIASDLPPEKLIPV